MPTPRTIMLDLAANRWRQAPGPRQPSAWQAFAHRYEAAVLHWLHQHPHDALTLPTLQTLAQQHGQAHPLNRAQVQRLLDAVNRAGAHAAPSPQQPLWTVRHAPRKKTTGPWVLESSHRFVLQHAQPPGLATAPVGAVPPAPPPAPSRPAGKSFRPLFLTANPHHWTELVHVLNQLLSADAAAQDGQHAQGGQTLATLLAPGNPCPLTSPTARLLVQVKLVRAHIRQNRFAEAQATLNALRDDARTTPMPRMWQNVVVVLQERLRYDQRASTLSVAEIQMGLAALSRAHFPATSALHADHLNQQALLYRRKAMLAENPRQRQTSLRQAALCLHGALLLALLAEHYQQVQAYAYNLSLVAELDPQAAGAELHLLDYVDRCCRTMSSVGRNTEWALISLAEQVRKRHLQGGLRQTPMVFAHLPTPGTATFWHQLVQRVAHTQNPREMAHAFHLAHWGFMQLGDARTAARVDAQLQALCAQHPGLRSLLEKDSAGCAPACDGCVSS